MTASETFVITGAGPAGAKAAVRDGRQASRPPDTRRLASPDARLPGQPEPAEASSGPASIGVVQSAVDRLHLAVQDLRCAGAALPGGPGGRRDNHGWDGSGLPARGSRVGAGRRRAGAQAPGQAGIEFRLLGCFKVSRAGRAIASSSFGGRRVRQFVQILLRERGRLVPKDVLIAALWPEREPADPGANLAVLASRARHALGESSLILISQGGYVFADDDRCWVDAEAFAAYAERGRMALASGNAAVALRSYRSALALWAGDPLVENLYEEWAQDHRGLLIRLYEEALEGAARAALQLGQAAVALHFAGILRERAPLHENGWLILMRAHAQAGDPAAAIELFHAWRLLLADELGLDPCAEMSELYGRIIGCEPASDPIRPGEGAPTSSSPAAGGPVNQSEIPEPTREILDWISDAAFVLDPGGRFLYINRRAAELAGRPASCLIGRTVWEIFPEEWSPGFSVRAEAALKERAPGYFRGFCPPASTWLDAALYPGGQGLLAVLRDVTGQVLAEEQVHRALAVVEASRSELESLTRPKLKGNRKVVAIA
jgi:PAS domain S-box-containing protein